jgi:hypothetical protein
VFEKCDGTGACRRGHTHSEIEQCRSFWSRWTLEGSSYKIREKIVTNLSSCFVKDPMSQAERPIGPNFYWSQSPFCISCEFPSYSKFVSLAQS